MMPWLILGVFNSYFFRVDTVRVIDSLFCGKIINGDNEHLAPDSARELREVHEGVRCLKGNSGVNILLVLSLHSPKVQLLISQTPADPGAGNSLGMFTFSIFKIMLLSVTCD